jgi:hypothetical protein
MIRRIAFLVLSLLLVALLIPRIAFGQVAVSASQVADAFERPVASAKLCFAPVDATETATGFRVGSIQVVPNAVCGLISNGVLQAGLTVAPSPAGIYYHVYTANRATGAIMRDYGMTPITGTSWTLDTYDPNLVTLPVSAISVGAITTLAPGAGASCTISGSSPYLLNCGIPKGDQGLKGDTGAVTATGVNGDFLVPGTLTASTVATTTAQPSGFSSPTAWGDSLTHGEQGLTYSIDYPSQLALKIGQPVNNQGVGGQTSGQVAVRMGAWSGTSKQTITSAVTIPTSGAVNLSFPSGNGPVTAQSSSTGVQITIQSTPPVTGYVAYGSGTYPFTPDVYPASAVSVAAGTGWTPVLGNLLNSTQLIWAGRNNFSGCPQYPTVTTINNCQVAADIAAMVAKAVSSGQNYVVLTVINGTNEPSGTTGYASILSINAWIMATYPSNYVDVRSMLVAAYQPTLPTDALDYANDVPPSSLRAQDYSATLSAAITDAPAAGTSETISLSAGVSGGYLLKIDSEYMLVTSGGLTATVTRGYGSTTPATHSSGAAVVGIDSTHLGDNWLSAANANYTNGYGAVASFVAASSAMYLAPKTLVRTSDLWGALGKATINPTYPAYVRKSTTIYQIVGGGTIQVAADGSVQLVGVNLVCTQNCGIGEGNTAAPILGMGHIATNQVWLKASGGSGSPFIAGNMDGTIGLFGDLYSLSHGSLGTSSGYYGALNIQGTSVGSIYMVGKNGGTFADDLDGTWGINHGFACLSTPCLVGEPSAPVTRLSFVGDSVGTLDISTKGGEKLTDSTDGHLQIKNGLIAANASGFILGVKGYPAANITPYLYSAAGTPLPTCSSLFAGRLAVVSDATSPTYMGAYTSGGAITATVICSTTNGTTYAWATH